MSIQRRVSVVLLLVIAAFGSFSYWLLESRMTSAFVSLETEAASTNLARAEQALAAEISQLSTTNGDWSAWDNSYRFIQGQAENYIRDNLSVTTFEQLDLNFVQFLNLDNKPIWGMLFDDETRHRRLLNELGISNTVKNALLTHPSTRSVLGGIVSTKFGPFVVSSRPIVRNDEIGPVAGTLIFGYLLDARRVEVLRSRTEVDLSFLSLQDPEISRLKQRADHDIPRGRWQDQTESTRTGYVEIDDLAGDPVMVMRVRTPRDISDLGQNTLYGTLVSFITLILSVAIAIWLLLRLIVVQPLAQLTLHIKELKQTGDMTRPLTFTRNDEIGELANAFSDMQKEVLKREIRVNESLQELEHQATHDALTGLANRRTLHKELDNLKESNGKNSQKYCVCIMDLDRFKVVNDTSGHAAGDALLVQVATLLKESVYTTDTVVRLGGDEFAFLLYDCDGIAASRICERVRGKVEAMTFVWNEVRHRIGISIGVLSVSNPYSNASEILQRADAACFTAKESGRNQVYVVEDIEPAVDEKRRELHWVQRLTTAIDRDQFLLFTQPIVPLQTPDDPQPDRLEVLVRLRNFSAKKLIPPGAFIPSAERYKLSPKIDQWVVNQMIKYTTVYNEVFGDDRMYWINLSGASLCDDGFTTFLEAAIRKNRVPHGRLNFEITESFAIQNIKAVSRVMQRLKALGCQFALDDFGTGFSSFGYLQSLPIDCLKIDGLIVRKILENKVDRMFVKSIIDIAHAMDIVAIAEFVESDELAEELRVLGADFGQGFALGRPQEISPLDVSAATSKLA